MSLLDDLIDRVKAVDPALHGETLSILSEHARRKLWAPWPGPQTLAHESEADELLYGGQAGGGKTDLILGLSISAHERSLVLRRINKDAVKLVERAEEIVGHRNGYNGQLQRWKLGQKLIEFGGCEQEGDKQRYKGDPHDFIGFDELCDFLESQYRFIIGWNRSAKPNQRCRVVGATNPPTVAAGLWVFKYWGAWLDPLHPNPAAPGELRWYTTIDGTDTEVDGRGPHMIGGEPIEARSRTFIPSSLADNPSLARTSYASVLASLPEELRRAYRDGDWTVGQRDDDYQVIPTSWIDAAQQRWTEKPPKGIAMTAMAVDVAPGGGDQRVIASRYGGWFAPLDAVREADKTGRNTAAAVVKLRRDRCPVIVDLGGGWGGDTTIALKDNGIEVLAFNGVAASSARTRDGKLRYRNKRAETTWKFREELDPSQEGGSAIALPPDAELKADLASYRWTLGTQGIQIEDKQQIRERLGRSPDKGDAAIMCLSEGTRAQERAIRTAQAYNRPPMANVGYAKLKQGRR